MSSDINTGELRQRTPSFSRRHRLPSARRNSPKKPPKQLRQSPKPIQVMIKSYSEPLIIQPLGDGDNLVGGSRSFDSVDGASVVRFNTLDDVLSCTSDFSRINAGYEKDAKVLITVTVEGSPGPIKILVKLGMSVEETIKLILQKYKEQGRTPHLYTYSASSFDLHLSYFTLQCLERSDTIGEVGSRSFYLRKNGNKYDHEDNIQIIEDEDVHEIMLSPSKQLILPITIFPPLIARKMNKFERRFLRLLKLLGCLDAR